MLKHVVHYHVVRQNLESAALIDGALTTLNGEHLVVAAGKGGIDIAGIGSSANVIETDVDDACDGAVHKIDMALLPFDVGDAIRSAMSSVADGDTMRPNSDDTHEACTSVAHVLAQNSDLRVLNDVVRTAGRIPQFADEDLAITLFAPTDAAFYSLFVDLENRRLSALLTDPAVLEKIVDYHVVTRPLTLRSLRHGRKFPTALSIDVSNPSFHSALFDKTKHP